MSVFKTNNFGTQKLHLGGRTMLSYLWLIKSFQWMGHKVYLTLSS